VTEFPDMVYRVPGFHRGPDGCTFDFLGVADDHELDAALASGWSRTIADAMGGELASAQADLEEIGGDLREALEAEAKRLGVSFNARTRDDVLSERIAAAR
jgi:hypothetical protein